MQSTLLPARAAAPVAASAADGRSGDDPVIAAALSRAEQRRDCGDLADAYGWAAYAHQLRHHRRPLPSPALRLRIAQVVAPLALRVGDTTLAAAVHDDLAALTAAADHEQALHARAARAAARHALGECESALRGTATVHAEAVRRCGPDSRTSLRLLTHLGTLYLDCGWHELAAPCLANAHTAAARYLPADDPLTAHLAAVAATQPNRRHRAVCSQRPHARSR